MYFLRLRVTIPKTVTEAIAALQPYLENISAIKNWRFYMGNQSTFIPQKMKILKLPNSKKAVKKSEGKKENAREIQTFVKKVLPDFIEGITYATSECSNPKEVI
jgi:hypothetical protein